MNTREQATIRSARYGVDPDHGILVLTIECVFEGGGQQSFQAGVDAKLGAAMVRELCAFFGVSSIDSLEGRECFVLRSWPFLSEPIEGFEIAQGGTGSPHRRWTKYGCARRHELRLRRDRLDEPEVAADPLTRRTRDLADQIAALEERLVMARENERRVRDGYVDWHGEGDWFDKATEGGNR